VRLVCNVHTVNRVTVVFTNNKWMALTKAGWCVVFAVDYPASSARYFCISQGIAATLFRWGGRVSNFLRILYSEKY